MRVAIVSTPRTCSSMLGTLFSTKFNLTDYSELFSEGPIVKSVEEKLDMMTNTEMSGNLIYFYNLSMWYW